MGRRSDSTGGTTAAVADREVLTAVARGLVTAAAPEELPLFSAMTTAYFDRGGVEPGRAREDMLGFGADAAVMLVTPAAFEVARCVFDYLAGQVKASVEAETADAISAHVHRLFHHGGDSHEPARLTYVQLEEVHRIAVEQARAMNLSEQQADMLGDSLVGSLAIE